MSRPAGRGGVRAAGLGGYLFVSLAVCVSAPLPLRAQTDWTNPGSDDWYLITNWSGAAVATSADDVEINNGGEAMADRASGLYTADPQTAALIVGRRSSPVAAPPESTGTLTLIDVDLDTSGPVQVGMVDTSAGAFLEATGTPTAQAGANAAGNLSVNGDFRTGYLLNGPEDARATASRILFVFGTPADCALLSGLDGSI